MNVAIIFDHLNQVMPFSTACNTPLSNFEASQNYENVTDPAGKMGCGTGSQCPCSHYCIFIVTISFPLVSDPNVSLLAWTTTPWTLPSNLALCVNADFEYIKIRDGTTGSIWIILEKRLECIYKDPKKAKFEILERIDGSKLKGLEYVPIFPYFEAAVSVRVYIVEGLFKLMFWGSLKEKDSAF
jgi:isoleucyl-tRNA synthetase